MGSGPRRRGEVEIYLDDESRPLLDSWNAWREKVSIWELSRIPGFSCPVEIKLLDLLAFQLDRELISHNTIMARVVRNELTI